MSTSVYSMQQVKLKCQNCSLKSLCIPLGLPESDIRLLEKLVDNQIPVSKGKTLFRQGDIFQGFYTVRSGAFKYVFEHPTPEDVRSTEPLEHSSSVQKSSGTQKSSQILAFYLPGDFFGLDAVHQEKHPASAIAIQESSVCHVDFEQFLKFSQQIPSLQRFILNLMSEKACESMIQPFSTQTAEQRLVNFLLQVSAHSERRGYSARQFYLPMQNKDIANHLGLAVETMSRLLTDLTHKGLIEFHQKTMTLLDLEALRKEPFSS